MTTAQIFQSIWAGLATASALALLGLYLNVKRRLLRANREIAVLAGKNHETSRVLMRRNIKLLELNEQHCVLRQEFERKLDLIVELEHQLDRTKPLKRT